MEFAWGSGTGIDPALRLAQLVGAGALLFAGALVVVTVLFRVGLLLSLARRARALRAWRPLLSGAILGDMPDARSRGLRRGEVVPFLEEWNKLHTRLRGEASENLNRLARLLHLDREARRLMASRRGRDRLLGIITAGHVSDERDRPALDEFLHGDDPVTSLAAARALLQIDAPATAPALLAQVAARADWPLPRLASILKEAGPEVMCDLLIDCVRRSPPGGLPRLLALLDVLACRNSLDAILTAMDTSEDEETVAACLRALNDPRGLPVARYYARDERFPVRLQATKALGRLGRPEDVEVLAGLLCDPVWWIRYRAAQGLAGLPFVGEQDLERLKAECADPFGRDALGQIISERRLG